MSDPYQHYIDGEWVSGTGSETFESENPATGETLGAFERGTPEDVESAVDAADEAFEEWRELSRIQRAEYLWDVYHELRERTDELGEVVTKECGKEISEGKADVVEAAHMVEWAAGDARHPKGDIVPSEIPAKDAYMRRTPAASPAVSRRGTSRSRSLLAHGHRAGGGQHRRVQTRRADPVVRADHRGDVRRRRDPRRRVQHGPGFGDAGNAIVEHEDVKTVLFTGSAEVGHHIQDKLGGVAGKRVACEMGGKNAIVVTEEADLDIAVHSAVMSSFKTTGQRCVSSERLIVHTDVYDEFKERFVEVAESVAVGDPLNEETFMGPLIENEHFEKVSEYNELARKEDVNVLVDRTELDADEVPDGHEDGHWIGPFVYEADPNEDLRCTHEEVFGPHVALLEYDSDIERAVEIQNDTEYGLAGAIVSENYRQINYYRDRAEVGLAYGNLPCIGAEVQLPFGGVKKSGNGYPSAREAIEAVTDRTAWTLNNSKEIEMAQGLSADIKTKDD